ncbi:MAG: tRNA 2-thiocytidine(32) synthetase TtcA [Deltaproteobacteria bacterium]|nr:tRNA 2-thiocytidine(32) synthetase TtcA [Deltaproteobacteria bacterium]
MTMERQKEREQLEKKLTSRLARTSIQYGVLAPGDRILVAVSGGKDSYCLLYLLDKLRGRLPFHIDITACHINQGQPGYDGSGLVAWLDETGIPHEIVEQDTYSVVARNTREGDTACAVCSRMRRGILYTWAQKLECNKVALGHHREDTLATLMLNLFYSGKIQAMPARYTTNDGRLEVVRPLIEVAEDDLRQLAVMAGFPIISCGLCSNQLDHKRKMVGDLLDKLERDNSELKNIMLAALKNIRPTHLLDLKLNPNS